MASKKFFNLTIGKAILPILFFFYIIYYDLFSPAFGKVTLFERFFSVITNMPHITIVIVILIILYFISCSVVHLIKKLKE